MLPSDSAPQRKPASVAHIKQIFDACTFDEMLDFASTYSTDSRKQVQALVARARAHYAKELKERERVLAMYDTMRELGGDGVIIGVDEVGRGPLAGPLTVGAVVLNPSDPVWGINDSKQLKPEQRELLAEQIKQRCTAYAVVHIPPEQIDACGMSASLHEAMLKAIEATGVQPDSVLIDGVPLHIHPKETCIVKGDAKVACIAAASIVAKVTRDALMCEMDAVYPAYGFAQNKGYGSAQHIEAIETIGLSPIHRRSFCQNFSLPQP